MKSAVAAIADYKTESDCVAESNHLIVLTPSKKQNWQQKAESLDTNLRQIAANLVPKAARLSISIVYIWFGILKVFWLSPATPLVERLHAQTVSFIPFHIFFPMFGLLEVAIGTLFLFPKATRLALAVMFAHLVTTMAPLILLPNMVWTNTLVPTLEGQYIIKNVLLMALGVVLTSHLTPLTSPTKSTT